MRWLLPLCLVSLAAAGCSRPTPPPRPERVVPVLVATVSAEDVPRVIPAIGQVQPFATVSVKPQVTGQIAEVHFQEGRDVKAGDLLYTIDKRPFEVALHQAEADLEHAAANAKNAERQAERYTALRQKGAVAAEQFEQIQLNRDTTAAALKSAQARVEEAKLNLEYCEIRSPISGRAGRRLSDKGNVVTANATDLVVLNQFHPIYVACTVAEQSLAEIYRYLNQPGGIVARITPEGASTHAAEGPVTFIDNSVKVGSGTIQLKATLANDDKRLWPGQYVAVELVLEMEQGVIVTPSNAIATGQQGAYTFIVKPDQTVELRLVEISRRLGDRSVIAKGLQPGEQIVIDGHSQLRDGAKIEIRPGLDVATAREEVAR